STVAGHDITTTGYSGDGGPATMAQLDVPTGLAVGTDGTLYISDSFNNRVRAVAPDGYIVTVAGSGAGGTKGDNGPALAAQFDEVRALAISPSGTLYMTDQFSHQVRAVSFPLPQLSLTDDAIADESGAELYVFDHAGRHLRTLGALTGALHGQFSYGPDGRVTQITNAGGEITSFKRDGNSNLLSITSPDGIVTTTGVANGYLTSFKDPVGNQLSFGYDANGLMTSLTDARGNTHHFTFDGDGRLLTDADPAGGMQTLATMGGPDDQTVTRTTALARVTSYRTETLSTGDERRTATTPDGVSTVTTCSQDGTVVIRSPDGSKTIVKRGPDGQLGMQAPVTTTATSTTPGGISLVRALTSSTTLTDPANPLSLMQKVDTFVQNGATSSRTFDAPSKTWTWTSAMGRQISMTLDANDHLATVNLPGYAPATMAYDPRGRLSSISAGGRTTTFSYDARGNLATLQDPSGAQAQYSYDADGRITKLVLPGNRTIAMGYDADGNRTSVTPPGQKVHQLAFDSVDLQTDYTPPDVGSGSTTTHASYDQDHAMLQITRPDGGFFKLSYDPAGRVSSIADPLGSIRYGYDAASGRLKTITARDNGVLTFQYDGPLVTDLAWSMGQVNGTVHATYDNDLRMVGVNVDGATAIPFTYDLDGLLLSAGPMTIQRDSQNGRIAGTTLGSVSENRGFDLFGGVTSQSVSFGVNPLYAAQYD
ncbi:MAG TPA: hypothetical protein VKT80_06955, partial [Chloroflexota bacterium]|nr:hypothetical protein [Chloroflexota bacterium]